MKKRIRLGIACLLASAAGLLHAGEPALRFWKQIPPAAKPEESLVAVRFDSDVYAGVRSDLHDVRLRKADGTNVPFLIRRVQEFRDQTISRRTWNAATPTLRPLETGGLEITLKLANDDPQPTGLRLVTPLKDFEQRVRILTSEDGRIWEPAGVETVVFDYSRYMDVRNEKVSFPASPRRHFRVLIDDVTVEQQSELLELTRRLRGNDEAERMEKITIDRRPFRIDRIEFLKEVAQDNVKGDQKRSYQVAGFTTTENLETRQTIINVATRREPLTSLEVMTSSRNFSRNCVLEIQDLDGVKSTWRPLAAATLSQIDFKSLKRENLKIDFPESRQATYRLVIDNRDNSPLKITGVTGEGNVYEAVFLATGNIPHQLAYGDPDADAPSYDTEAISTLLTERFHPEILIPENDQRQAAPAPVGGFKWSRVINDVRVLTAVIGLLVVVLGCGLYSAVKRMDIPPPPSSPPESPASS